MTDNRYGVTGHKYGTGKYGASDLTTLLYGLWVDWNNDDVYPDVFASGLNNEAFERMTDFHTGRGRWTFLRDSDQGGFAPYETGKATITLDNRDDRYNPLNTSSPLYPNCSSGKKVRFYVQNGSAGGEEDLFTGEIDDIELVGMGADKKAIIHIADGWRWLRDTSVTIALQTAVESENAIGAVLDAAEWPALWGRDIGAGADTLAYWWEDSRSPSAALKDLADSEYGRLTLTASGAVKFRSRTAVSIASAAFPQEKILKDIGLRNPFKSIRDKVTIAVRPRVLQSSGEVWRLQDVPQIAAGTPTVPSMLTIWAGFKYNNEVIPVLNQVTPVATTDYTANSAADGSGSNLTANITVTMTSFGSRAKLVISNTGAAAYITLLKVRGEALNVPNVSYAIAGSGVRNFDLELPWQQTISLATGLSEFLLTVLEDLPAAPIIKVEGRPELQFLPDVGDEVNVTIDALSIDSAYQVGYIEHRSLEENCQAVLTTLTLEPLTTISGVYFTLNDLTLGELNSNRLAL